MRRPCPVTKPEITKSGRGHQLSGARETWLAPNDLRAPVLPPHAPRPLAPAGNWVRFSCSIRPSFVLSHNMPIINATDKLASFWRFSITASSLASGSLAIMLSLHASRSTTPDQRGQIVRKPSPAGYCQTPTTELGKTERDPISTIGPSIQYVTESGDPVGKIKLLWALASWCATRNPVSVHLFGQE